MKDTDPKYILAIAEHGSISKAAEALFVSQPYMSKMLIRLEKELGAKLFDRRHIPLLPTRAGEMVLEYCAAQIRLEAKLLRELRDLSGQAQDRLAVGAPPIRGSFWLPLVLPPFSDICPHTQVVIHEYKSNATPDKIAEGEVDLGVFTWPAERDDLVYQKLFDERMLLMVPRDHPLAYEFQETTPFPRLTDDMLPLLDRARFISIDTPNSITKQAMAYLAKKGVTSRISITTKNNVTTYRLCERGMGLAIIMEAAANNTVFYNSPCFYQLGDPPLSEPWYCAYRKKDRLSPSAKIFLQLVAAHVPEVLGPRHFEETPPAPPKPAALRP